MKKTILAVAALLIGSVVFQAAAQHHTGHNKQKGHEKREHFAKKLNLSDEQKAKAQTLNHEFKKERKALMQNEELTVKQQRDQLFALRKNERAAIENLLTDEQKTAMKKMHSEGKDRQSKHLKMMEEKLSLTQEQVKQLQGLHAQHGKEMEALKNANTRQEHMALQKQMKEQRKASLEKVLTKEQVEQLEKMNKSHRHHARPEHAR